MTGDAALFPKTVTDLRIFETMIYDNVILEIEGKVLISMVTSVNEGNEVDKTNQVKSKFAAVCSAYPQNVLDLFIPNSINIVE